MPGAPALKLRLFVAAPEDLATERDLVIQVADRFNRRPGVAEGEEFFFEVYDWSDHLSLNMGTAERKADARLPVEGHDVFVGLAWLRFSVGQNQDQGYRPSSRDDFDLAFHSWEGAPQAPRFFYRCQRLPQRLSDIDGVSYAGVDQFFKRFSEEQRTAGICTDFMDLQDLGEALEEDFYQLIERARLILMAQGAVAQAPLAAPAPEEAAPDAATVASPIPSAPSPQAPSPQAPSPQAPSPQAPSPQAPPSQAAASAPASPEAPTTVLPSPAPPTTVLAAPPTIPLPSAAPSVPSPFAPPPPAPPLPAPPPSPAPPPLPAPPPPAPEAEFERKMVPGSAYEVSFLGLRIPNWDEVSAASNPQQMETLQGALRKVIAETASSYGGEIFVWKDEGPLLIFWRKRSRDHAIMTGLKVIHAMPVFNLDPQQNPLPVKVEICAAAHDAVIVFQLPSSGIRSDDIDFVLKLEYSTQAGEICVSKRLLDRADERLAPRFQARGRFEGEPVYICRLPASEQRALHVSISNLSRSVGEQSALIRKLIGMPTTSLEDDAIASLRAAVDQLYSHLDKVCGALGRIDSGWSRKFSSEIAQMVSGLVQGEGELWQELRRSHVEHQGAPVRAAQLEAIVKSAASRRSRPAVTLAKVEHNLRARTLSEAETTAAPVSPTTPAEIGDEVLKKIDALLRADPLDIETAMTDLLLNQKDPLLAFLATRREEERHRKLLEKLWAAADLVVLDDLYSIRGHKRARDRQISIIMADPPITDSRFAVVRDLLAQERALVEADVKAAFDRLGPELESRDQQTIWRCMVLGHPVQEVRSLAAFKLSQFSMWQAISHPSIPLASVCAIGERVSKAESDDNKKIFFDCIRSRIADAVESFKTREEFSNLTKLILLLLDFPFLVETGYFERFDEIMETFLARAQKAGLKVDYFENLRKPLEIARQDPENQKAATLPAGIKKLPLTLQRRLAAEPQYVFWFVTHPDARVASETLRHIRLANVERVMKMPEVNSTVMASLLRKPELFTRSGPLLAALNNPKCDQRFAGRYLPNFSRSRGGQQALQRISRNSSANPAVRTAAKRLLDKKPGR